jgi:hypothetical protein
MEGREKTSVAMTPRTKLALEALKLRLRRAGIARSEATEGGIIEALVALADYRALLQYFERR